MIKKIVIMLLAITTGCSVLASTVVQSARDLPVVRECDVVVVGGNSAAVAAALSAKSGGASVFLVAPRTYLGDDIAGTRELWPEAVSEFSTVDLAQQVFALTTPYTYTVNITPDGSHPDPANTRLTDGVQFNAVSGSVQYNSDAQITATFQGTGTVAQLDVYYYERPTPTDKAFDTDVTAVEYSLDGANWTPAAISVDIENLGLNNVDITTYVAHVTLTGGVQAQYIRIFCDLGTDAVRQLLDEIIFHTDPIDPIPGSYSAVTPLTLK